MHMCGAMCVAIVTKGIRPYALCNICPVSIHDPDTELGVKWAKATPFQAMLRNRKEDARNGMNISKETQQFLLALHGNDAQHKALCDLRHF
eukprot:COSAG02_NODE_6835_length_3337_cov_4.737492_2_plen_91_part_00